MLRLLLRFQVLTFCTKLQVLHVTIYHLNVFSYSLRMCFAVPMQFSQTVSHSHRRSPWNRKPVLDQHSLDVVYTFELDFHLVVARVGVSTANPKGVVARLKVGRTWSKPKGAYFPSYRKYSNINSWRCSSLSYTKSLGESGYKVPWNDHGKVNRICGLPVSFIWPCPDNLHQYIG